MKNAYEFALRAVVAAAAKTGTVRIKNDVPLRTDPPDLFDKTLTQAGISDEKTIRLFESHLQSLVQSHLPSLKITGTTADTRLDDIAGVLWTMLQPLPDAPASNRQIDTDSFINLCSAGTHGADEPPPQTHGREELPPPKKKGQRKH